MWFIYNAYLDHFQLNHGNELTNNQSYTASYGLYQEKGCIRCNKISSMHIGMSMQSAVEPCRQIGRQTGASADCTILGTDNKNIMVLE